MKNKPRRISYNGHRYTPKEILTDLEGYVIEAKSTRAEMVNGSSKDPNLRENLSQTQNPQIILNIRLVKFFLS